MHVCRSDAPVTGHSHDNIDHPCGIRDLPWKEDQDCGIWSWVCKRSHYNLDCPWEIRFSSRPHMWTSPMSLYWDVVFAMRYTVHQIRLCMVKCLFHIYSIHVVSSVRYSDTVGLHRCNKCKAVPTFIHVASVSTISDTVLDYVNSLVILASMLSRFQGLLHDHIVKGCWFIFRGRPGQKLIWLCWPSSLYSVEYLSTGVRELTDHAFKEIIAVYCGNHIPAVKLYWWPE